MNIINNNVLYCVKDPRTNEVRYIGIAKDFKKRQREHLRALHTIRVCRWIQSLQKKALTPIFEAIESYSTPEELHMAEMWAIKYARLFGYRLLNMTDGGEGTVGYKHTPETKKKLREAKLGKPGVSTPSPMKGKKIVGERLRKIQEGTKHREWSVQMQEAFIKNKHLGPKALSKKVECSNGIIYNSAREAARLLNLHSPNIIANLKGRYAQVGGYTFKYYNEKETHI
jgi:group I intron endonuclease